MHANPIKISVKAVLSFRQDLIDEMKSQIQGNSANVLGGGHIGRKVCQEP